MTESEKFFLNGGKCKLFGPPNYPILIVLTGVNEDQLKTERSDVKTNLSYLT
jgi:hypothetical protein